MPLMGFEPTIPAFEQAKTVHALDCAVTVISDFLVWYSVTQNGLPSNNRFIFQGNVIM
jgi:hypothetical protein